MIEVDLTYPEILERMGVETGRGNRCKCPIHGGNNPSSFSWDEEKGSFKCFSCGARGDKIALVMFALRIRFKEALAFLGIDTGRGVMHPVVSPQRSREAILRRGLNTECRKIGRGLRNEFYHRNRIIAYAQERLAVNHEDELGWALLEVGYKGVALDEIERLLDIIDIGSDEQKLRIWRVLRLEEKYCER